jgi:hypothetical protein
MNAGRMDGIPRGVEVLVKKAAIDPAFKATLLDRRAGAAAEIGLSLEAAEEALLNSVPAEQLERIIAQTDVPPEHRRTFLSQAGVAMLATLGGVAAIASCTLGSRPDLGRPKPDDERGPRPEDNKPAKR